MAHSNRAGHEASPEGVPPGDILAPSPLLTLGAFVVGVGIDQVVPVGLLLTGSWLFLLGVPLIVVGSLFFGGAIWTMRRHDKHPAHSDEPPTLITDGPFQYSRNPIYVGHSLVHVGASVLLNSVWPLVTLVPLLGYLRRVVQREENRLEALFGSEYNQYRAEVRRWL
jgi:protein-S-isoprenylcysteine O-methyltransferase Ste14